MKIHQLIKEKSRTQLKFEYYGNNININIASLLICYFLGFQKLVCFGEIVQKSECQN